MTDLDCYTATLAASVGTKQGLEAAAVHLKIGDALMSRKRHADAVLSYQAALHIRLDILGEEALKVANVRHSVGVALLMSSLPEQLGGEGSSSTEVGDSADPDRQKAVAMGIELLEGSLRVRRQKLGVGHVDVAETAHFLGLALSLIRARLSEALEMLHLAFRVRSAILGQNNALVAETLEGLGHTYHKAGNERRAIQAFAFALSVKQSIMGENSSEAAAGHLALAQALTAAGDHDTALKHSLKGLSILKTRYGPDDQRTAEGWLRAGICHANRGDSRPAVKSTLRAIRIFSSSDLAFNVRAARLCEAWAILAEARWEMQDYELAMLAIQVLASGVVDSTNVAPGEDYTGSMIRVPTTAQVAGSLQASAAQQAVDTLLPQETHFANWGNQWWLHERHPNDGGPLMIHQAISLPWMVHLSVLRNNSRPAVQNNHVAEFNAESMEAIGGELHGPGIGMLWWGGLDHSVILRTAIAKECLEHVVDEAEANADGTRLASEDSGPSSGWFPKNAVTKDADVNVMQKLPGSLGGGGAGIANLSPPQTRATDNSRTATEPTGRIEVSPSTSEYDEVVNYFSSALYSQKDKVTVLKVERNQNFPLWQSYAVKRQTVKARIANLSPPQTRKMDYSRTGLVLRSQKDKITIPKVERIQNLPLWQCYAMKQQAAMACGAKNPERGENARNWDIHNMKKAGENQNNNTPDHKRCNNFDDICTLGTTTTSQTKAHTGRRASPAKCQTWTTSHSWIGARRAALWSWSSNPQ